MMDIVLLLYIYGLQEDLVKREDMELQF